MRTGNASSKNTPKLRRLGEKKKLSQRQDYNRSEKALLNTRETATFLGMGVSTLEQERLYGRLGIPFCKIGRSCRYRRKDLEDYLASLTTYTSTSQIKKD